MVEPNSPTLDELGRELLHVPRWRLLLSLITPFVLASLYWVLAFSGWWVPAAAFVVVLSFVTYGSISHDLVHRALGLQRRLNDLLLTAIELLLLRSGRAYRLAHLNHHARYPDPHDDPEGRAAYDTLWVALLRGPLFFPRLWLWAVRHYPRHRARLLLEGGRDSVPLGVRDRCGSGRMVDSPADLCPSRVPGHVDRPAGYVVSSPYAGGS
jgi:beta-carotene hydroxylase